MEGNAVGDGSGVPTDVCIFPFKKKKKWIRKENKNRIPAMENTGKTNIALCLAGEGRPRCVRSAPRTFPGTDQTLTPEGNFFLTKQFRVSLWGAMRCPIIQFSLTLPKLCPDPTVPGFMGMRLPPLQMPLTTGVTSPSAQLLCGLATG